MRIFFWAAVPFCIFTMGYGVSYFFIQRSTVIVPSLIGKNLKQALACAANRGLSLSLLHLQEDNAVADGTILGQSPAEGSQMRYLRPIMVTVASRPAPNKAFDAIGLERGEIETRAKKLGMRLKVVQVSCELPAGVCFGQFPTTGQEIGKEGLLVYLALTPKRYYVLPDFGGCEAKTAISQLDTVGLTARIVSEEASLPVGRDMTGAVIAQVPQAGKIVAAGSSQPVELVIQGPSSF